MTITEAIEKLEELEFHHDGNIQLKVFIQTGPDSYEWKNVTDIQAVHNEDGTVEAEVSYE